MQGEELQSETEAIHLEVSAGCGRALEELRERQELARELGVTRRCLYKWRTKLDLVEPLLSTTRPEIAPVGNWAGASDAPSSKIPAIFHSK